MFYSWPKILTFFNVATSFEVRRAMSATPSSGHSKNMGSKPQSVAKIYATNRPHAGVLTLTIEFSVRSSVSLATTVIECANRAGPLFGPWYRDHFAVQQRATHNKFLCAIPQGGKLRIALFWARTPECHVVLRMEGV